MFLKNMSSNFMKIKSFSVKPELKFHHEAVFFSQQCKRNYWVYYMLPCVKLWTIMQL